MWCLQPDQELTVLAPAARSPGRPARPESLLPERPGILSALRFPSTANPLRSAKRAEEQGPGVCTSRTRACLASVRPGWAAGAEEAYPRARDAITSSPKPGLAGRRRHADQVRWPERIASVCGRAEPAAEGRRGGRGRPGVACTLPARAGHGRVGRLGRTGHGRGRGRGHGR